LLWPLIAVWVVVAMLWELLKGLAFIIGVLLVLAAVAGLALLTYYHLIAGAICIGIIALGVHIWNSEL
jgi:hypothetical protein